MHVNVNLFFKKLQYVKACVLNWEDSRIKLMVIVQELKFKVWFNRLSMLIKYREAIT